MRAVIIGVILFSCAACTERNEVPTRYTHAIGDMVTHKLGESGIVISRWPRNDSGDADYLVRFKISAIKTNTHIFSGDDPLSTQLFQDVWCKDAELLP